MDFLQQIILDNTVQNLLLVAGVILLVVLFKKLLSHYTASITYLFINSKWKMIGRKEFAVLFFKPLSWFLIVAVSLFSLSKLNYPKAWYFKIASVPFDVILQKIAIVIFIYSFFRLLLSVIDFIALILSQNAQNREDRSGNQLVVFFRDFIKVILTIAALLLVLKAAFNQDIGNLLTGLSIVGAALALSARESLENLIASFIIFFDKPFYVGDSLKVNNVTGTVERIGLRSTRIRTADKTLVTVPNKQMVDNVVDNTSMRTERRAEIKLDFSEKTKASELENFLAKVKEVMLHKEPDVLKFTVFLTEISKAGASITIEYFTLNLAMAEFNKIKQEINLELIQLMDLEKMEMANAGNNIHIIGTDAEAPKSKPII